MALSPSVACSQQRRYVRLFMSRAAALHPEGQLIDGGDDEAEGKEEREPYRALAALEEVDELAVGH